MSSGIAKGTLLARRYRLEQILGTGGMASVWLAHDERLGRPVAVKVLSDTLTADPAYLERFRREARLAAGLSHENLVAVYDFGESDRPYLAMEYVAGETLAERIAEGTAADLDASDLAQELLAALEHIHEAGIVHRDIKPANVLITLAGTAKVTDFGIAQPPDATQLTKTGFVVGTRSYMAPEVLRGERATARSDLYACGMVLREVAGDSMPASLATLVGHLGAEDPGRRPGSAAEALAELANGGDSAAPTERMPTAATTRMPASRPAATLARRWRWRALAAVLTILVLGGIAITLGSGDDEPSSSPPAPAETGSETADEGAQDRPGASSGGQEPAMAQDDEEATAVPLPPPGRGKEKEKEKAKGKKEKPSKSAASPGKAKGKGR
jgi:eukaryotic-like serine/threonine-protein kinase